MKTAQPHAQGWSAECPHCGEIDEVNQECASPKGDIIECVFCQEEYLLTEPYL